MSKLRVGLLFGGRSVEHEVSITSASSIFKALDPSRYEVVPIVVGHDGHWRIGSPGMLPEETARAAASLPAQSSHGAIERLVPGASGGRLDVVLPIIHGSGGEDGSLQGFLELAGVPYVGAGVLASAIQMDKDVSKRLLRAAGLLVVPWVLVRRHELAGDADAVARRALDELGLPLFVKPACLGSSVGISHVVAGEALLPALREAARYDQKILVERAIDGREIEVAVLGNEVPEASLPGEIRPRADFYDYEAKYVSEDTELLVPATLDEERTAEVRRLALEAYAVLEGAGLARVDFFLERGSERFYLNELNSLPGFTDVSMYPRLWEASGLPYPALLDRLIELALERHRRREELETTYRRG